MSEARPTPIDEVDESNRQAELLWGSYAKWHPKGEIVRHSGVTAAWCHGQWPLMNGTLIDSPVRDDVDLEQRIQTALEHGQKHEKLWMLAYCEEWLPSGGEANVQEILTRFGLQEVLAMTGMVADDVVPPAREVTGLELRSVADVETRQAVADINAISYDLPVEWGREILDEDAVWNSTVFGCVGYADGKAVSTATH